jgi:protein involved in polysaccharide export with SLBB domain
MISFPLVGQVRAGGLTLSAVEAALLRVSVL